MGFESPKNNLEDKDKIAKEQFDKLPERIKEIALKNNVNPEKIVSSSLQPEEVSVVEGTNKVIPSVPVRRAKQRKEFPTWIEKSQPPEE